MAPMNVTPDNTRFLLQEGNLKDAIEILWKGSEKTILRDKVLLLFSRYNLLINKKNKGVITNENYISEENQLIESIIVLINKWEENFNKSPLDNETTSTFKPDPIKVELGDKCKRIGTILINSPILGEKESFLKSPFSETFFFKLLEIIPNEPIFIQYFNVLNLNSNNTFEFSYYPSSQKYELYDVSIFKGALSNSEIQINKRWSAKKVSLDEEILLPVSDQYCISLVHHQNIFEFVIILKYILAKKPYYYLLMSRKAKYYEI